MARTSRHPVFYSIVTVTTAAVVIGFWLAPGYVLAATPQMKHR
jgi:hypothetical protein